VASAGSSPDGRERFFSGTSEVLQISHLDHNHHYDGVSGNRSQPLALPRCLAYWTVRLIIFLFSLGINLSQCIECRFFSLEQNHAYISAVRRMILEMLDILYCQRADLYGLIRCTEAKNSAALVLVSADIAALRSDNSYTGCPTPTCRTSPKGHYQNKWSE